jgi:hypothetical protein
MALATFKQVVLDATDPAGLGRLSASLLDRRLRSARSMTRNGT